MTTPGIHLDIENEGYHAGPGVSKSGLWTISQRTPAHFRFCERKETNAFDLGTAAHFALLQPELIETKVSEGPADRRGNKWKEAELYANSQGKLLLTEGDYETVLRIRDSGNRNSTLCELREGAIVEASGYAIDPETGTLCRCRPDAYNPTHGIIMDLKTTTAGGRDEFARSTANFGYHMQEAFYSDVWARAVGARYAGIGAQSVATKDAKVNAFIFVVIEKAAPFLVSCYELKPGAVDEGREGYKRALRLYAQCKEREDLGMPAVLAWPGYPEDPEPLDIPNWAYRFTKPEEGA